MNIVEDSVSEQIPDAMRIRPVPIRKEIYSGLPGRSMLAVSLGEVACVSKVLSVILLITPVLSILDKACHQRERCAP
jgi:hypothetical protein